MCSHWPQRPSGKTPLARAQSVIVFTAAGLSSVLTG